MVRYVLGARRSDRPCLQNVWHVVSRREYRVTVQFRKPGFDHGQDGVSMRTPAPLPKAIGILGRIAHHVGPLLPRF
jgi:hypothetical protein